MVITLYEDDFVLEERDIKIFDLVNIFKIECQAKIEIDGKIFYNDWFNPLEFYFIFKNWHDELLVGNRKDLVYNTMDNDKNPILSLLYSSKENGWLIYSVFEKYQEKRSLSIN